MALASVTQWIERQPANWKVTGSIPSQGTCLGSGPGPCLGPVQEAADWSFSRTSIFLALSFSLPFPLSKNK